LKKKIPKTKPKGIAFFQDSFHVAGNGDDDIIDS